MCRNTVATGTTYNLYNQWFICPACFPAYKAMYPAAFAAQVFREGDQLAIAKDMEMPALCVKCGTPADRRVKKEFSWAPPWTIVGILGGVIPYVILVMICSKKGYLTFSICDLHRKRRMIHMAIAWFMVVMMPVCCSIGVQTMNTHPRGNIGGALMGLGFILLVAGMIYGVVLTQYIRVVKVDDRYLFAKKLPAALEAALLARANDTAAPPPGPHQNQYTGGPVRPAPPRMS